MRNERNEARVARSLYENFWTRARTEANEAAGERDQAQRDRDTARKERDLAQHDREQAVTARDAAEADRDKALSERDRAEAIRRRVESDLAHVTAELAALRPHPIRDRVKKLPTEVRPAAAPPLDAAVAVEPAL
ncbi:hypothetical protein BH11MYX1_BH11MYX1_03990 [soil metagenome]